MWSWDDGYNIMGNFENLSVEDQKLYYIGWKIFYRRNERSSDLPKLVFSILPNYSELAHDLQLLAKNADIDAWFETMGIQ